MRARPVCQPLPRRSGESQFAAAESFSQSPLHWLVVTTGERRIMNMLRLARRGDTKGLFYFTIYNYLNEENILFAPIWRRADRQDLVSLFFMD